MSLTPRISHDLSTSEGDRCMIVGAIHVNAQMQKQVGQPHRNPMLLHLALWGKIIISASHSHSHSLIQGSTAAIPPPAKVAITNKPPSTPTTPLNSQTASNSATPPPIHDQGKYSTGVSRCRLHLLTSVIRLISLSLR